ncbi:hypothetical protein EV356DRAFT_501417, partial [Viridothelium virens]
MAEEEQLEQIGEVSFFLIFNLRSFLQHFLARNKKKKKKKHPLIPLLYSSRGTPH